MNTHKIAAFIAAVAVTVVQTALFAVHVTNLVA